MDSVIESRRSSPVRTAGCSTTKVPTPWEVLTSPSASSSRRAARNVGRDTPNCAASSASGGNLAPGVYCPAASALRRSSATRDTSVPLRAMDHPLYPQPEGPPGARRAHCIAFRTRELTTLLTTWLHRLTFSDKLSDNVVRRKHGPGG